MVINKRSENSRVYAVMDIREFIIFVLFLFRKDRKICFNANIWFITSNSSISANLLHDVNIVATKCLFTLAYKTCLLEITDSIHVVFVGSEQGWVE